jgi:hypothetical protein
MSKSERPSTFIVNEAFDMNEMWSTCNTAQERLIFQYNVAYVECECCERRTMCFVFEHLGMNVCAACERTYSVHTEEESYK